MDTLAAKLPHHLSKLFKKMKEEGLIDESGVYVGEMELGAYLKSQETPEETQEPKEPNILLEKPEEKEATIPVSQLQGMVDKMVAERMKNIETPKQEEAPRFQSPSNFQEGVNVDDIPELRNWEIKDRIYELCDGTKPVSCSIPKEHTSLIALQYTNKEKGSVHIMRYATNQPSFFVEKQSKEPGSVLVSEIIFTFGRLSVPANNIILQKFLAIHPYKDVLFREYDPLALSVKTVSDKKLKLKAGNLVFTVGEITNRAIASLEFPNYVDSWEPSILEEELSAYAEKNPQKYIDYAEDPTVKMKGVIKASINSGELIYANNRFLNKKRETIIEVSRGQNELDEMVAYIESGVGKVMYEYLLNKL